MSVCISRSYRCWPAVLTSGISKSTFQGFRQISHVSFFFPVPRSSEIHCWQHSRCAYRRSARHSHGSIRFSRSSSSKQILSSPARSAPVRPGPRRRRAALPPAEQGHRPALRIGRGGEETWTSCGGPWRRGSSGASRRASWRRRRTTCTSSSPSRWSQQQPPCPLLRPEEEEEAGRGGGRGGGVAGGPGRSLTGTCTSWPSRRPGARAPRRSPAAARGRGWGGGGTVGHYFKTQTDWATSLGRWPQRDQTTRRQKKEEEAPQGRGVACSPTMPSPPR